MLRPTSLPGAASRAPAYRKDIATPKSSLKHFLARDTLPRDAERKGRIFDATPNQLQYRTARNIHVYAQGASNCNEICLYFEVISYVVKFSSGLKE